MNILKRFLKIIFIIPFMFFVTAWMIIGFPLCIPYWIFTGKDPLDIPIYGVVIMQKFYNMDWISDMFRI